ncbi:MAG: tRNA (guanosine(37)-N1)-methyltransferase TrmD [Candidatus Methylacidiphilales bacterium]
MKIDLLTLFPEMTQGWMNSSILKRAMESGRVLMEVTDVRDFAQDRHRTVDDRPFGGGPGMVMMCDPLVKAIESVQERRGAGKVLYMTPEGRKFEQKDAKALAEEEHLIFVSGHYEGIDERVRQAWVDEEWSVGDYILTNGTLASMVMVDAVVRLLPGVLGNGESAASESFEEGLLEGPHYTRPDEFRGMKVPEILLGGNHEAIRQWRKQQAMERTRERRPDLWRAASED